MEPEFDYELRKKAAKALAQRKWRATCQSSSAKNERARVRGVGKLMKSRVPLKKANLNDHYAAKISIIPPKKQFFGWSNELKQQVGSMSAAEITMALKLFRLQSFATQKNSSDTESEEEIGSTGRSSLTLNCKRSLT